MSDEIYPPAAGVRLPWEDVPEALRRQIADFLGGDVVEAVTQTGGFSPAAAVRLRTGNGRRAFVKACGSSPNPDSIKIYRWEAGIAGTLPAEVPAPRLLTSFDTGDWVALVFEDIEGRGPALPWRDDELRRVLDAIGKLTAALTPSPVAAPTFGERHKDSFTGWRRLLLEEDKTGLDPWALRHLDALAELESGFAAAAEGDTLVHADLRADNLLLTEDQVYVVDWPWACVGAPWIDIVAMLPSVRMQGGPPPQDLFDDPDPAVTAVLAALTGYFVRNGRQPDPPGLPTVRAFQRAQGVVALEWLRHRTGWP
ncbi:phosphotransferase family protein [Nonomuraea africana]|uniref:Aminoglycoside phosphotransferase (APT) family kinase protein n=1 Tax=Nonomuraea africana TaxID=46171 RepID=A0ABR9KTR2_9ACTN|nr:aminoglycoside phosphotransferase family protein [Nonomuraea africana]MBE1565426.1 aminoglycoside phosphotransferase (APT) family kinase protein [Nonomuraea africana]